MTITNFHTYLAAEIATQSLGRKYIVLDLETVISSCAVATRPDFDVKNGTKGILFNRVSFVIPFKQTLF